MSFWSLKTDFLNYLGPYDNLPLRVEETHQSLFLKFELTSLSGGELLEKITEEGYTMSEAEVINYMRQVCEGVKHMHERNVVHLGKTKIFQSCQQIMFT